MVFGNSLNWKILNESARDQLLSRTTKTTESEDFTV